MPARSWPGSPPAAVSPSSPAEPACTCERSGGGSRPKPCRPTPCSGHGSRRSSPPADWTPLVTRLRALAPERATTIDARNPRRVVRALEIATLDGGRGRLPEPRGYPGPSAWIGLAADRPTHLRWIAARARAQFDAGLVDEARVLRERFDPTLPAFSAIGYREAWAVLDGTLEREAAIAEDARRNAAFAKRQRTWFRAEPGIEWLDVTARPPIDAALRAARGLVIPPEAPGAG